MDADELMAVTVPLEPTAPDGKKPSAEPPEATVAAPESPHSAAADAASPPPESAADAAEASEPRGHVGTAGGPADGADAAAGVRVNDRGEPTMMLPSFIWDFFVKDATGKFVICTLCAEPAARFAYSGGTSTMNRHLRKKHHKFAPGKTAADYDRPRKARGGNSTTGSINGQSIATTHATSNSASTSAMATALTPTLPAEGSLSPAEASRQRQQVLELRTSRRKAATAASATAKRRKMLHQSGAMDPPAPPTPSPAPATADADFDPSAFVTLPGSAATGAALAFPAALELGDAAMELGLEQRFFDYSLLGGSALASIGASSTAATNAAASGLYRPSRRSNGSIGSAAGSSGAAASTPSQKLLTHRLLRYLIAQFEPLDVSPMGNELALLLYGTPAELYGLAPPPPKLPSEESVKRALATLYYSQREMLKDVLAEVDVLSLSLDNWTSVFAQNVLTVRGHWISPGFGRRDCVLEVYVLPLDERVNTIALLRDVLDKWDIPAAKVAALTTAGRPPDEAPQIRAEFPDLAVVDCFVRALDGAVQQGLLKCAPLTRRCRNYVSYFIQNPSEYQIFLALQRRMAEGEGGADGDGADGGAVDGASSTMPGRRPLPVICDVGDRWNSTSEMVARIVELEPALLLYKTGLEADTSAARRPMQLRFVCCELSRDEWDTLKQLARLLAPLEGAVHVSQLAFPGLSIVYPALFSLRKHLADAEGWISNSVVAAVRNAISSGLAPDLCAPEDSAPYLACLLDPRFKALPFLPPDERARLVDLLYLLHDELVGDPAKDEDKKSEPKTATSVGGAAGRAGTRKAAAATLLHEFFPLDEPATELDKLRAQVQQYLDSPALPATDESESDPLEWWSRYQRTFPTLARLAKKFLCMSAVCVPFQEAFSNYGQLMREKRARLDIEVAAQVLFCRSVSRIPEMERMNV